MHQRESLSTYDASNGILESVVDELTEDGCQFLTHAVLDKRGHLHIHVRAKNTHLFHRVTPLLDVEILTSDGRRLHLEKTLGHLNSRFMDLLGSQVTERDLDFDLPLDVNATCIKTLKVWHSTSPNHHNIVNVGHGSPNIYYIRAR